VAVEEPEFRSFRRVTVTFVLFFDAFTDTGSFIFWVKTPDLHADMADMRSTFLDTSNFPPGHPLYSDKNKRKLGFFKSESGPYFPSQFCGLRSKMYSLSLDANYRWSGSHIHEGERRAEALRQETGATWTIPARVKRMEHHDVHVSDLQIEEPHHRHSQTVENMSVVYQWQTVLAIGRHNVVAVRTQTFHRTRMRARALACPPRGITRGPPSLVWGRLYIVVNKRYFYIWISKF